MTIIKYININYDAFRHKVILIMRMEMIMMMTIMIVKKIMRVIFS